jgi:hypothetical protein
MKSKRLFFAINNIDDKYIIEDAQAVDSRINHQANDNVKRISWLKLAMPVAACLVIAVGLFFSQNNLFLPPNGGLDGYLIPPQMSDDNGSGNHSANNVPSIPESQSTPNAPFNQVAHGFLMNDKLFSPIAFLERQRFGLVDQTAVGLTPENIYIITESDLGEVMGVVESSSDVSLIGATVYHFSDFPDTYAIVIVEIKNEVGSTFEFFTFGGYNVALDGATSDVILDTYGVFSDTVSRISVFGQNHIVPTAVITDNVQISTMLDVLRGHSDIGFEAHEELVLNWLEIHEIDSAYRADLFDDAGRREIRITTNDEIELTFFYFPFVNSFFIGDSYFIITDNCVDIMNTLLLIN